ncbi:MAG: Uma2 family endonuclease [Geitlerinemataceae cyanobacterium]
MLANDPLYITPEDYLAAEEISPIRHEYRDGEVFAMTGGTLNHNAIILNVALSLKLQLRGSGCRVFAESAKVRIETRNAFYYPDIVVTCDDRDRPSKKQYAEHPSLIVEVLSPSTARYDRTEKFADYRTIPSLCEFVLVSTDLQQVEHFYKDERDKWNLIDAADPIQLTSVNCSIALAEIYDDTDIPAA